VGRQLHPDEEGNRLLLTRLFNHLIREHGPLFAGMVTNLVPVGALIWGWIDHEQVTPQQITALAGLIVMVTLVQYGAAAAAPVSVPSATGETASE
jgi:hypothetical protein